MINGHGDDAYCFSRPIISNFSSNVFAGLDNGALKRYLSEHLDFIDFYPQPTAFSLCKALGQKMGLTPDEVCVTNGATEAIYLIAQAFSQSTSAILMPTFSEYGDACRLHRHRTVSIFDLKDLPGEAGMCWLCNPNNPTGEVRDKAKLIEFIQSKPQTLFVVDQSYESFTFKPLFSAAEAVTFPNLILLHSMTKQYKIAGIRLGYVTACESLIKAINCQRMPWSVNNLAIVAGHFLLNQTDTFDMQTYLEETARLKSEIEKLGVIEVWPSDTHILLCKLRCGKSSALKSYLVEEHGILIRDASNFEGLNDQFFRVATQSREENNKLVTALAQWIQLY